MKSYRISLHVTWLFEFPGLQLSKQHCTRLTTVIFWSCHIQFVFDKNWKYTTAWILRLVEKSEIRVPIKYYFFAEKTSTEPMISLINIMWTQHFQFQWWENIKKYIGSWNNETDTWGEEGNEVILKIKIGKARRKEKIHFDLFQYLEVMTRKWRWQPFKEICISIDTGEEGKYDWRVFTYKKKKDTVQQNHRLNPIKI